MHGVSISSDAALGWFICWPLLLIQMAGYVSLAWLRHRQLLALTVLQIFLTVIAAVTMLLPELPLLPMFPSFNRPLQMPLPPLHPLAILPSWTAPQLRSVRHRPTAEQPYVFVDFEEQAPAFAALEQRLTLAGRDLATHPVDYHAQQREKEQLYHQRPGGQICWQWHLAAAGTVDGARLVSAKSAAITQ